MQDTILRLCASTALVGVLALPATAQQIINLEEITFSANLTETEIRRAGASVTVLDRDQIEQSGTSRLSDLLATLPGVSIVTAGGVGAPASIRLRGAGGQYVAVYVDGIRIDDPTGTSVSTDLGQISLQDVDRLELLRGSQSALYGGSAVAGVINISTRRAQEDGLRQSAFIEGGSFNTRAAGYGLTYRDDRLEAALSFSHFRTRGFTAYEGIRGTEAFSPDAAPDGYEATRLSFSGKYQVNDVFTLGWSGFFQHSRSEYDPFDLNTFTFLSDGDAAARWQQGGLRVTGAFDLGDVEHTLGAGVFDIQRTVTQLGERVNRFDGRRYSLDYTGLTQLSPDLALGWGTDFSRETAKSDSIPDGRATSTLGAYGQVLWSPTDALDISANARIDRHSSFGNFVTGRLSMAYQASDAVTLRGAVARGFRAPALDELFGDYPDSEFIGNPELTPERSNSAEIGADYRAASGLALSATVFWLNTQNRIGYDGCELTDPENGDFSCFGDTLNTLNNFSGTSRRRGVELSADVPVTELLSLSANYTYTNARNPDESRISGVARHTANLAVNGQIQDDWRYTLSLQHVAGRPTERETVWEDYTVANAAVRYRVTDATDLYLRVDNLFDRNYQVNPGYKTSGRAFYIGVASRF
ncbi:TonB-dependent receptor plug domain-containing protein [Roseinatronobacter bogoriensis]|uniref:TonB-dependent receptor n=1 Tax=Roseinatronobacter bogoriensis subsp. barguzinensis TaxID=441209 RepID=A0A2K8K9K6_9RHOB|nr:MULTISPECIES: TonB-dependent receptor [Rhodobaca]ATX65616.1 TonB-dependent receptor [Rhodobaca barguzinensis]MBB4208448.1 vitamin B12 transporter [Rhodobaca bogoriensis DSM 18756]TDW39090.1 vitamin B12 transporter [Rhodobaca barguzinensis]TDY66409.1 vitamin B12 transporter [Rhodobaca bogoriensis DSM 18756]